MKIDHISIYVNNLEQMKDFYTHWFVGIANDGYHNPKTGLRTYFLSFDDGTRLELMSRPDSCDMEKEPFRTGYTHLAFSVGSRKIVDQLTSALAAAGTTILSGPRVTGDGYYESCILDPEGNQVEITA